MAASAASAATAASGSSILMCGEAPYLREINRFRGLFVCLFVCFHAVKSSLVLVSVSLVSVSLVSGFNMKVCT
jgi:hypothetical protein